METPHPTGSKSNVLKIGVHVLGVHIIKGLLMLGCFYKLGESFNYYMGSILRPREP